MNWFLVAVMGEGKGREKKGKRGKKSKGVIGW